MRSMWIGYNDFPNNEMGEYEISDWEVALSATDKLNITCIMHDTRLCKMQT